MRIISQTFWRGNCFKTHVHITADANSCCKLWETCMPTSTKSFPDRPSPSLQLVFTGLWLWSSLSITDFITWVCSVWKNLPLPVCVCLCASSDEFRASTAGLPLRDAFVCVCTDQHLCTCVCVFMRVQRVTAVQRRLIKWQQWWRGWTRAAGAVQVPSPQHDHPSTILQRSNQGQDCGVLHFSPLTLAT